MAAAVCLPDGNLPEALQQMFFAEPEGGCIGDDSQTFDVTLRPFFVECTGMHMRGARGLSRNAHGKSIPHMFFAF